MRIVKIVIEYEDGYSAIETDIDEIMIQFYELLAIGKECGFEFKDIESIWYPKHNEFIQ